MPRKAPQRKDVTIHAETAVAYFGAHARAMLYDPERPKVDPNELLKELGGRMTDPRRVNHNCPWCHKTLAWELFVAHLVPCVTKWYKVQDVTNRRFTGATLGPDLAIEASIDSSPPKLFVVRSGELPEIGEQ